MASKIHTNQPIEDVEVPDSEDDGEGPGNILHTPLLQPRCSQPPPQEKLKVSEDDESEEEESREESKEEEEESEEESKEDEEESEEESKEEEEEFKEESKEEEEESKEESKEEEEEEEESEEETNETDGESGEEEESEEETNETDGESGEEEEKASPIRGPTQSKGKGVTETNLTIMTNSAARKEEMNYLDKGKMETELRIEYLGIFLEFTEVQKRMAILKRKARQHKIKITEEDDDGCLLPSKKRCDWCNILKHLP